MVYNNNASDQKTTLLGNIKIFPYWDCLGRQLDLAERQDYICTMGKTTILLYFAVLRVEWDSISHLKQ
jgi:hypothetical protein